MDKGTIRKTLFLFLVFATVTTAAFIYASKQKELIVMPIFLVLIYVGIISYGIFETPIRYEISDDMFTIVSRWNRTNLKLRDIQSAKVFNTDDRKGVRKKMGAEGVLGSFGSYSSDKHNELSVVTSRDTNWVLITKNNGKKVIISPDDLDLVNKINAIKS